MKICESTIDFPQKDLPLAIWAKTGDSYVLKANVAEIIFNTLRKYTQVNLREIADDIHITGSIGTNQYTEGDDPADLDVHIVVDENKLENAAEVQADVFKFFRNDITYVSGHPIEVYLQYNPQQEMLAEAVYDIDTQEWVRGPKIVDSNYDPYDDFSDILDIVREMATEADVGLGELKRDAIDYTTLVDALTTMTGDTKQNLLVKLHSKLDEIVDDIEMLKKLKGNWIEMRRDSSKGTGVEKTWRNANAKFKYLSRYKYMQTITVLEKMLSDNKLDSEEIDIIKNVVL